MKKPDLGQTLSIIANFSVLLGILLLAFELNQNRDLMRAQTRNSVAEMRVNLAALEASSPELTGIMRKFRADEPLDEHEYSNLLSLYEAYWRYRENVHYQYLNGMYEPAEYEVFLQSWINDMNDVEAARDSYCDRRSAQSQTFTDEIDEGLLQPCD